MRKPVVYLSGPIQLIEREKAKSWRNAFKRKHSQKFDFLDPMDNKFPTDQQAIIKQAAAIVRIDKHHILDSDIVFASTPFPSVGTSMEIMWAHMHGRFVAVMHPDNIPLSAWIVEHANVISPDSDILVHAMMYHWKRKQGGPSISYEY